MDSIWLMPPPLPLQPVSLWIVLSGLSVSVVPPTATTLGEMAGQLVTAPVSPEDATNVTPGWMKWES